MLSKSKIKLLYHKNIGKNTKEVHFLKFSYWTTVIVRQLGHLPWSPYFCVSFSRCAFKGIVTFHLESKFSKQIIIHNIHCHLISEIFVSILILVTNSLLFLLPSFPLSLFSELAHNFKILSMTSKYQLLVFDFLCSILLIIVLTFSTSFFANFG